MNETRKAPELLENAALLVQRALDQLNADERGCPTCGRQSFVNNTEGRIKEGMLALPERLRNAAGRLRNEGGGTGLRLTMADDHEVGRKE